MPEIGSVHKATIKYGDVTEENSTLAVYTAAVTALSIADFLTDFGDFQLATDAITLGTRRSQSWIGDESTITNAYPTDRAAQRESKLKVDYWDNTTEKMHFITIPTIDFSKLNFVPGGGDAVQFEAPGAHADIVTWVAAFEAFAHSPDDPTHSVTVKKMTYVGRNT